MLLPVYRSTSSFVILFCDDTDVWFVSLQSLLSVQHIVGTCASVSPLPPPLHLRMYEPAIQILSVQALSWYMWPVLEYHRCYTNKFERSTIFTVAQKPLHTIKVRIFLQHTCISLTCFGLFLCMEFIILVVTVAILTLNKNGLSLLTSVPQAMLPPPYVYVPFRDKISLYTNFLFKLMTPFSVSGCRRLIAANSQWKYLTSAECHGRKLDGINTRRKPNYESTKWLYWIISSVDQL